jgi:hypothetical protein
LPGCQFFPTCCRDSVQSQLSPSRLFCGYWQMASKVCVERQKTCTSPQNLEGQE